MDKYNHKKIEAKWQKYWEKKDLFRAIDFEKKPKQYILIEFPYPSGEGLHTGHCRSYTALDIIARKKRMEGFNVLFPIGWDAFGLPTENYALRTGIHPIEATKKNTDTFRRQLKSLGFSFDWSREINTTDPKYYKWTQWIFLQLYKKGLAYKAKMPINFCPSCKIGLANEEVIGGKCERCGAETSKKEMEQWMLRITKYADRLIKDLDKVNYQEKIKKQQINWIGKSIGATIDFKIKNQKSRIKVFTTRADTLFGATYMVLSPEHEIIPKFKTNISNYNEVNRYIIKARQKSDTERADEKKEKTGVELKGIKAINPINNQEISIFVADYVLSNYGTGAIMAVPAHDKRDWKFAKKYNLPITEVIQPVYGNKHKDEETRETITAIVKNKKGKFLFVEWKEFGWIAPIIGGTDGESSLKAAEREVLEETGYKVKAIENIGGRIKMHFYAENKKVWRERIDQPVLCELLDEKPIKTNKEEAARHRVIWLSPNEAKTKVTHQYNFIGFERYLNNDYSYIGDGELINSDKYNGLDSRNAAKNIIRDLKKKGLAEFSVNYKLRDWVFSRQHYWGEPIPIVYCDKCGEVAVKDADLPVELPMVEKYEPTNTGESPLANIKDWVETSCPKCRGKAKRETDTMPNWAGSSWYFLRYLDPHNDKALSDKRNINYWMPVDLYNGGMEHTTLHLLYSRFWYKFFFDIGIVPNDEPYQKRTSHGVVLAEGGVKMSKSKGNIINPDDIVNEYGADTLRLYEMFMGPFGERIAWDTKGILGVRRFLDKIWQLFNSKNNNPPSFDLRVKLNQTIKKVTEDIEEMSFNTAVSAMMEFLNLALSEKVNPFEIKTFILLLYPLAPHISEEIWQKLDRGDDISRQKWPKADDKYLTDKEITIVIQINGKLRDKIKVQIGIEEDKAVEIAKNSDNAKKYLSGKNIKNTIFVPNKLINFVT